MPRTKSGNKILRNMIQEYGREKGIEVFSKMENAGTLPKKAFRKGSKAYKRQKRGKRKGKK